MIESTIAPGSYGDVLATLIAGVALVATTVLVIIGFRLGANIQGIVTKIEALETNSRLQSKEFDAIYTIVELVREQLDCNYRLSLTIGKHIQNIEYAAGRKSDDHIANILSVAIKKYSEDTDRILLYLLLFKESEGIEFANRLSNVTAIYPDEQTISFLESLEKFVSARSRDILKATIHGLKIQVRKFDASKWTGRVK